MLKTGELAASLHDELDRARERYRQAIENFLNVLSSLPEGDPDLTHPDNLRAAAELRLTAAKAYLNAVRALDESQTPE